MLCYCYLRIVPDGNPTNEPCALVLFDQASSMNQLLEVDLQRWFPNFRVRYGQGGFYQTCCSPQQQYSKSLAPGVSIGWNGHEHTGTLGGFYSSGASPQKRYLLTNEHVLRNCSTEEADVCQPGRFKCRA